MDVNRAAVLVVDHTALPGGAELALPRIARHSSVDLAFLFLEPDFEKLRFPEGAKVVGPDTKMGLFAQLALLRAHLRSGRYEAVLSNSLRAAVYISLFSSSIPHFLYLQDGVDSASLSGVKRRLLRTFVLPRVFRIFPNSAWTAASLGPRYSEKSSPPIFSPSGIVRKMEPDLNREGVLSTVRLLSLSRVVEWKGVHVLINALAILAEQYDADRISLTVAGANLMGPDSYLGDLTMKAAELPFDVEFVGHHDDISALLGTHDVLVHASIRPEPFGQVVVQGLAAGLAVIASDAGGPVEIIQNGKSGLLHEASNAVDLAKKIALLVDDLDLRRSLQEHGFERSVEFEDSAVVARFDREVTSALEEARSTGPTHMRRPPAADPQGQ